MQNQGQNWQKTGSCVPNVGLSGNPSNLSYRGGDRSQAVPRGTGKEKKHNKTQKLNREHLFSPDRGPVQPCGGPAWFQEPPKSSISQGQLPDALGPHRVLVETSSCPREYHACTLREPSSPRPPTGLLGKLPGAPTHPSPHSPPQQVSMSSADTSTLTRPLLWMQIRSEMASTAPNACRNKPPKVSPTLRCGPSSPHPGDHS